MILLDTHVVLWLGARPERLSRAARTAIDRAGRSRDLAIASVSLVEIAQLGARGGVRFAGTPSAWLRDLVSQGGLRVEEITTDIAAVAAYLPPAFPPDPFDRIIAATAIVEGVRLVTSDARIQKSGAVETIW